VTVNTREWANGIAAGFALASAGFNLALHAWMTAASCALIFAAIGTLHAIGTAVLRRLDAQTAWFLAERGRAEATTTMMQRAASVSFTVAAEPERVQ
jgi:hypothetical protein